MASNIIEFFGYDPSDSTEVALSARRGKVCPFIGDLCQKTLNDHSISGACTIKPKTSGPVIICPNRLYASNYSILSDVTKIAFGEEYPLLPGSDARAAAILEQKKKVAVFGKRWGKELRLPNRGRSGGYYVDWVLALLNEHGQLVHFVAIEVQSIDTTGNYQEERLAYIREEPFRFSSSANPNWENVNKRILPQLIYKGHVLRREKLCAHGLFFLCPTRVYEKIKERLGGNLLDYVLQPGSLTFMWYDVETQMREGEIRPIRLAGSLTTTIDQVALAFTSPSNLPPRNVYEKAITAEL